MPQSDEYSVQPQQLEAGLRVLQKRQRNLMMLGTASAVLLASTAAGLWMQQDFVYSFFGLTLQVEQLHVPVSVSEAFASLETPPDYFLNLLSWFGWLIVKLFSAFFGAFFAVHLLKKIKFFYLRFQSFVLKFVGWLISFMLIWGVLSYAQYDWQSDGVEAYQELVYYDRSIQDSAMARDLKDASIAAPVKHYLLAQTALLHQPADRAAAIPHVQALMQAETRDPEFLSYGFKPEQLWSMQQQLFEKPMTPLAQSVSKQAAQAAVLNAAVQWFLIFLLAAAAFGCMVFFILAAGIKKRAIRIEQRLH